jgi:predicted transcriptional regulator
MKEDKKLILHLIISEIKKGKNPSKISKEHNIKKQTLQYYLRQLKQKGIIKKEGYGIWKVSKEVSISSKATKTQKQIRGHAFNWKVKFKHNILWERRLKDNNIKYQLIGIRGSTPRIIFNDKKIWFTKTGLVIYEPKSFFSQSSLTSKGKAVWELDKTIKALGRVLKIDLGTYEFKTSREHYGMIDNELARQYNDKGEKLYIKRKDGSSWMWIDLSHGINELENDEPIVNRQVQNWFNDMKKTKFEVTPTFLLNSINQVTQNQIMFDKNFQSHLEVIKNLNKAVLELREEISRLKNEKESL